MPNIRRIRLQLGTEVVEELEAAVSRACVASISREADHGALETLMVSMLTSVIATHGNPDEMRNLAHQCADLILQTIDLLAISDRAFPASGNRRAA